MLCNYSLQCLGLFVVCSSGILADLLPLPWKNVIRKIKVLHYV